MTADSNSSVDQVFDVLALLSGSQEPTGVAQLARALDVPTSTAHRVLATLEEARYVTRDTTGTRYELGLGARELTHALLRRFPVQTVTQPLLRQLAAATGETAVLSCRVGWYAVRIASAEGAREVHAAPRLGETSRLHDTTAGRAILAFHDEELRGSYLRWLSGGSRLNAAARALRTELEETSARGYAAHQFPDGRSDLALPVQSGRGGLLGSIAVEAAESDGGARTARTRLSQTRTAVTQLEALLRSRPELAYDPFAHFSPDELSPGFDPAPAA